ncbi:MAG: PASTA domain-containing protein [Actinomycetia bacterium]|nr:PASTA domain-containing protein [Actinomycetes bacterium]
MTLAVLAATIGFTGPASAAPVSWVMPDVRQMVLRAAVKTVQESTGVSGLQFRYIDRRNGQDVHNEANWVVCYQSPTVGKKISQKSKRVNLYVKRFNQKSCWQ